MSTTDIIESMTDEQYTRYAELRTRGVNRTDAIAAVIR